jgi:hypothetical protein
VRLTNETLLISAILNSGDANLARDLGIREEHFNGYSRQYGWIMSQQREYGHCPTPAEFKVVWPDFPHDEDITTAGSSADRVRRAYMERQIRQKLIDASRLLESHEVEDAYRLFDDCRFEVSTPKPENALVDYAFMDDYEGTREPRIEMPWDTLQNRTQGIGPGELWYFAARQGHGKSAFLINMAGDDQAADPGAHARGSGSPAGAPCGRWGHAPPVLVSC